MSEEEKSVEIKFPVAVAPPDNFDFTNPKSWSNWKKRFERFMCISGHLSKPEDEKINLLIYIMGEQSENVLLQFDPKPITYDETLKAFD